MSTLPFTARFQTTWADLDANVHLRNTGYLDYAAQTRFLYLRSKGVTPWDFQESAIGPVVFKESIVYAKELHFLEEFTVQLELGGINDTGSKFILVNRVVKESGETSATVTSEAAWFDLKRRKIAEPQGQFKEIWLGLTKADSFIGL
jgi:acyl-CoA thioester hydrolase